MRTLFLFGGLESNFKDVSMNFAFESGGQMSKIALLLQGSDSIRRIDDYVNGWKANGISDIDLILPDNSESFIIDALKVLSQSTGIFIGGGMTLKYKEQYVDTDIKDIILDKYNKNVPYAGLSAGAVLAADKIVKCKEDIIEVYKGLGILKDTLIMPHFEYSEEQEELLKHLQSSKSGIGLGIDGSICLKVTDEKNVKVYGAGNCHLYKRTAEGCYETTIFKPGDRFAI